MWKKKYVTAIQRCYDVNRYQRKSQTILKFNLFLLSSSRKTVSKLKRIK